jgi:hypothetical protein
MRFFNALPASCFAASFCRSAKILEIFFHFADPDEKRLSLLDGQQTIVTREFINNVKITAHRFHAPIASALCFTRRRLTWSRDKTNL